MATTITLSLVSHTNVGKTTLARTLLRRDVGEVLDQAHVTDESESHTLLESEGDSLALWDTPGFGDTARLLLRLRREGDPLGWFLHQIYDRVFDRPLWCSQQAVRNVREQADVVLYLVNAAEDPEEAGYVRLELELLSRIGRPVLLLLNQTAGADERLLPQWRTFTADWPIVRDVLPLDAFTRCWVEEGILFRRVEELLEGEPGAATARLRAAWEARNLAAFRGCCRALGGYLARAAADRETLAASAGQPRGWVAALFSDAMRLARPDRRRAMAALDERLDRATRELMDGLIAAHGLENESAAVIERRVQDFQVRGAAGVDERTGAVAGAVVSGALGGLAADVLSGGLSLGGGMIAGGILGALGGSALARGYRFLGGLTKPRVSWTEAFLDALATQALVRYLAVAHHGRGRGPYRDLEQPVRWSADVAIVIGTRRTELHVVWTEARRQADRDGLDAATAGPLGEAAAELIEPMLLGLLRRAYPHAPLPDEPPRRTAAGEPAPVRRR